VFAVGGNHLILWIDSISTVLIQGESNFTPVSCQNIATSEGRFTITTNTDIRLDHWISTATVNGLGGAVNRPGFQEVFASITLQRID
jgi:hypothetical protein